MATPYKKQKVFIDGIEVNYTSVDLSLYTEDIDTIFEIERNKQSNVSFKLRHPDLNITMHVEAMERDNEGNIHLYGGLRRMFPDLFKDRELLQWQRDYLFFYNYPLIARYKVFRDDKEFDTERAKAFYNGHICGYKNGYDDGLKGK